MKKIKVKVETEKKGLFGKKKVTEYKTIEVDNKTYKKLMKEYNSRPYSLEERISYKMPTYWKGRNIIHFAAFKNHIGLYPGGEATTFFADRLTDYKTSKGTIQFPLDRELPHGLIAEIAEWAYGKYAK